MKDVTHTLILMQTKLNVALVQTKTAYIAQKVKIYVENVRCQQMGKPGISQLQTENANNVLLLHVIFATLETIYLYVKNVKLDILKMKKANVLNVVTQIMVEVQGVLNATLTKIVKKQFVYLVQMKINFLKISKNVLISQLLLHYQKIV